MQWRVSHDLINGIDSTVFFPDGKVQFEFRNYSGTIISLRYDENGHLIRKTYGDAQQGFQHEVYTYQYDNRGMRMRDEIRIDGQCILCRTYTYTYYQ
jgi:YD repeat-containing protein